jgi:hypothetical protein
MAVKRSHFVPKVYLRGFCNPDGRLWVYDALQRKGVWESDPGSVAYEKNLYAVELPDGSVDRETLERAFGSVETRFPAFRDKVNKFPAINGEDSSTFITFQAWKNDRIRPRAVLTLQIRLSEQEARVRTALSSVEQEQSKALKSLLVRDSPPIWSDATDPGREWEKQSGASFSSQLKASTAFIKRHPRASWPETVRT